MKSCVSLVTIVLAAAFLVCFLPAYNTPALAAEKDAQVERIKEQYPEAYKSIYEKGKKDALSEAGKKEGGKRDLGKWWKRSSLFYDPMPEGWLLHGEGQYSYARLGGNEEGYAHKGGVKLIARKHRFTNFLSYYINKYDIDQSDGESSSSDYRIFQESLRYDVFRRVYGEAGFVHEVDEPNLVDERMIGYAGAGVYILEGERHFLSAFGALGYQDEEYDRTINQFLGLKGSSGSVAYLSEAYHWQVTDWMALSEEAHYFRRFDESDKYELAPNGSIVRTGTTNNYRLDIKVEADFMLSRALWITVSYQYKYDNNPWPSVEKDDTVFMTGFKLNLDKQ